MINCLDDLLKVGGQKKKLVVVGCHEEGVIKAIIQADDLGLIDPILIGNRNKTDKIFQDLGKDINDYEIIDETSLEVCAEIGVKSISKGYGDFLMKGIVDTSTLLRAVLNKDWGLRNYSLLSHIMVYEIPSYSKLIYITDGGMNIEPSVEEKAHIIENSSIVVKALGKDKVRVAILAAKEKIHPKMKATIDAVELKKRYENNEFTKGVIVDGPMALDLAISREAANIKNYRSEVAGKADILLVPNIEMGNGIGKSITYFANGKSAGIIMGAKVPIVLASRSDTDTTKLYSIALGKAIVSNIK
ncbi:bifunctional enoyl-CoA hydratase/phosphate acetyltransferase [Wansuia hejianensis]|uniref:Bifunctional enoyl-CoA hydratase/phosphate acetyltransferase n=1 Tax=Wansuia hejianensis TaxID=2763667 RepID=A0A926IN37_9FIRM|nr:bifunctional enoyl-CoA hydratase/phosphate acetyltransferase [Wansuia hejianensis]MBC8591256.1 bifunctional enoyl-CoA hydratase/phosphate acetyltransferase [Wansuia hejianensis]